MNVSRRVLLPLTLLLVAVLGLAACGSDDKTSTNSDSSSTNPPTSAPAAVAVVKKADQAKLGAIVVDADGKTVYTLTKDGAAVACTGGCLTAWPPVMLPAGTETATGDGVKGLTVVKVADGNQVASDGLPLYTFSGDAAAGDANGEGLASFGGVWHVVKVGGGAASTDTTDTSSSDIPGY